MSSVLILYSSAGPGNTYLEDDCILGNAIALARGIGSGPATFAYPDEFITANNAAGQTLNINLVDPLGLASLNAGSLTSPSSNAGAVNVRYVQTTANVTIASNGVLAEWGNDADADILASNVGLSALTGVGTPANALETQAFNLEAETASGGINIRNFGGVAIGGVTPEISGLSVGISGNLNLDVHGTITLNDTDGFETVKGGSTSGNVTLNAIGANSSIVSIVDKDAIAAPRGNVTLTAGHDISFGSGSNFDNDVRADGNITITAGGSVRFDGFADLSSDGFGHGTGGDVSIVAGAGVFISDIFGTDASVGAEGAAGGSVTVSAGTGSVLSLQANGSFALFSVSGDVLANADRAFIASDSGISALDGKVTIRPQTAGRGINLGSVKRCGATARAVRRGLDRIFTPTLVIGGSNAGAVTVTSGIGPANVQDLIIQSGSDITVNAGFSLFATDDLTLKAGDDIRLLAGAGLAYGGTFSGYVDVGNGDPGEGGTAYVDASLAAIVRFFGGNDSDTLWGGANNDWLDGSAGADTLRGRTGDDTYVVDNAGDATAEASGEGVDTVRASLTYTLAANVEVLTQLGSGDINGTGNTGANTLNGNSGDNTLNGNSGDNTLNGMGGNDTLLGNAGNDALVGGAGNDAMNGGNQIDTASYAGATGGVTVALIGGAQATGGSGTDTLANIENLTARATATR